MNLRESIRKSLRIQEAGKDLQVTRGGFLRGLMGAAVSPGSIARAAIPVVAQAAVQHVAKAAVQNVVKPPFKTHGQFHPNWSSLKDNEKLAHAGNHHFGLKGEEGWDKPLTHHEVSSVVDGHRGDSDVYGFWTRHGSGIGLDQTYVHPTETGHAMYEDPFYVSMRNRGKGDNEFHFDHVDHKGVHTSHSMEVDLDDAPESDDYEGRTEWLSRKMDRHIKKVTGAK